MIIFVLSINDYLPESMIKGEVAKLKAEHPVFAAVLDTVRSMNATETLKAILAIHALERILDAHALNIETVKDNANLGARL